jgi:hypothetical protein
MKSTFIALGALTSIASAHFNLNFPVARGFDEEKLVTFPCGSFNTPSTERTPWPLNGGQIALKMGHVQANVEVFIGFGDDVGTAFNTVLRGVFQETGLGDFCMTGFSAPAGFNVTDGTKATLQVVTNGDPEGGLYNCADIVFSSSAALAADGVCTNGTGVAASGATISTFPNGTAPAGGATTTDGGAATPTSAGPAAASSTKPGAANGLKVGMSLLLVAAAAGFALAL